MMETVSFWESSFVWRDAMIVALISAAALSYLGVWVVLKRVTYVPLALTQVSSVGVVAAFLLGDWLGHTGTRNVFDPTWMSLLFAGLASVYFAGPRRDNGQATVVAYLLSAATVLILGGFIRQDLHDVSSLLFGNAVMVETVQIVYVTTAALCVGLVHFLFYRRFLFSSYDTDSAGASAIPVLRYEILLYLSFALMIAIATRAIGALPVFGFTIFPALTGLRMGRSMLGAFTIAVIIGLFSAGMGYYLSFIWELPTGACMVALTGAIYLTHLEVSWVKEKMGLR